jgi:hypothetical protein
VNYRKGCKINSSFLETDLNLPRGWIHLTASRKAFVLFVFASFYIRGLPAIQE